MLLRSSLGLHMNFKTLFMSDFDLLLFFNKSKQFLAPGGLNADVFKLVSCKPGASRELDLRPQGLRSSKCSKLIFGNIIIVIGTNLIFFVF